MQEDDETTAEQLVGILHTRGHTFPKQTTIRARTLLGLTSHGSRYCQMIRNAKKEKRVEWAQGNLNNTFNNVVWTDESMIMLENHCTFATRRSEKLKTKGTGKAALQGHSLSRNIKQGGN